jgi:hypothetical protein
MFRRRALVVPKAKGEGQGKKQPDASEGGGRRRQSRSKRTNRGKGQQDGERRSGIEPAVLIDPDLAVMARVPLRTSIVAAGHQHLVSPVEIAELYNLDVKYVSDQFKALVKADLLELVEKVKVRGVVQHMYRSTKRAFVTTGDWSQFGTKIQEGMSGAILQDLNGQVARSMEAGTLDSRDDRCLFWECLAADEISWANSARIVALAIKALKEQSVEAVNRQASGESDGLFPATFALLGFESPVESDLKQERKRASRATGARGKEPVEDDEPGE